MRQLWIILVTLTLATTLSVGVSLTSDQGPSRTPVPVALTSSPIPRPEVTAPVEQDDGCTEETERPVTAVEAIQPADDLELREDGLGPFDFGDDADEVDDGVSERLGTPTSATRQELVRYESLPGDDEWRGPFAPCEGDLVSSSYSWTYEARRDTCWRMLCVLHGLDDQGTFRFVAWSLSAFQVVRNFDASNASSDLQGSPPLRTRPGLDIGTSWSEVQQMYPEARAYVGEGASFDYEIGWPEPCGELACDHGRLETKRDPPDCGRDTGNFVDCPPAPDARVLSIMAGEHPEWTCC